MLLVSLLVLSDVHAEAFCTARAGPSSYSAVLLAYLAAQFLRDSGRSVFRFQVARFTAQAVYTDPYLCSNLNNQTSTGLFVGVRKLNPSKPALMHHQEL